jgi:DNA polymerase III, alpha subunit
MYRLNSSDIWQEGCRNSQLLIADRVDASGMFEFINLMPRFPIPAGYTSEDELFRAEVWKGMDRRYPDGYDDQRRKQAEYEIQVICQMGFPAYFLCGGLHHVGEEQRRRGRPGPWLGGRLDRLLRDGHHRP